MSTFDTPQPISVSTEFIVGDLMIVARDREDTVVEVRPADPSKEADVTAAEQTGVEYENGRLSIKAPKMWRRWTPSKGAGSIEVRVELPTGSQIRVSAGVSSMRCTGRLGGCILETGVGDIRVAEAGPVRLKTGAGDVEVDRAVGHTEIRSGSGTIEVGQIDGTAVIKNANGDTWVGEATSDLRVSAGNGRISVDHAESTLGIKTACGDVRIGDVARGSVVVHSGFGSVDVGVRAGVAAWLELDTKFGRVDSDLDTAGPPEAGEETVEVHARTSFGDITIRRATPVEAGAGGS